MIPVDSVQYEAMRNRVLKLEIALSQLTAGRNTASGTCPICARRFENAEWVEHVRNGCSRRI
jgi:hypothetical protein